MRNIVLSLFFALCLLASCTQPIVEVFGSISGYVVDEDTGEAVAGARVAITPVGLSQVTAVDGEFLFDNLDAQEYTLSIKKDGYQDMSQKVSVKAGMTSVVQVALKPIQPVLKVEPSVLDFGDESSSLALDITNAGKGTLEWTIEEDIDWLTCTQQSGSTSDKVSSIVVKASREGLGVGSYSETIVVSSNGGSAIVKVKLSVGNSIKISVEPKEIDFGAIESDVELIVKNNGITAVKYTASSSNQWLTLSKSSSSVLSTDYLHAIVSREGLAAGSYTSSVVISTEGGDLVIPVKMEVAAKSAPIVTLENVDDITYSSAVANGTIVSVGSSKVFRYGFCISAESKDPTVDGQLYVLGDSMEPKSFSALLTNLESNKTYYVRSFAENQEGIAYSNTALQFTTADLPKMASVSTGDVISVETNSAVVLGSVDHLGNVSKVTAYGHVWNTTGSPTLANGESTDHGELATTSQYSSSLEGLEVGTKYYVRAYATNEKGTSYGSEQTFTTNFGTVELRTSEATDITHESAVIEGEVVSDGRNEIVEKGVVYSKSPEPDRYAGKSVAENGFTCTLTGLSKTTTYYARSYAKTSEGKYFYGNEVSFTTKEHVTVPTVSTGEAENITEKSVEVSGNIVSTGYSTVTEYGHVLGLDRNINKDGSYLWKTKYGPIDSQTGFTSTFNQLEPNTMYYVRAYATNDQGTVYGDVINFKTDKEPVVVVTGEPAEITINSARLSAEILYCEGHVVVEKGFIVWPYGATGSDMEIVASSAFEATVDGLHDNTQYMVQAYVKTSEGRVYYDKDGVSFTTVEAPKNPTNGLYAYYTFENDTKNTVAGAVNASGINVSYVDGKQGTKALKFTTKDALLNVPEPLIDGRDFTISFWVKDLNDGHIFDVVTSSSYKNSNVLAMLNGRLRYVQSGFCLWRDWNNEEDAPLFTHSTLSSDWHHVAITSTYSAYLRTEVCLYLDGECVDKITTECDDIGTGTKFVFGGPLTRSGYSLSLNWIAMTIDNLRVYNSRVLTAEEVKQIYEYEK